MTVPIIAALLAGAALGGAIGWLIGRGRSVGLAERLSQSEQELLRSRAEVEQQNKTLLEASKTLGQLEAALEHERQAAAEKLALLTRAGKEMNDAFQALAAEALRSNNQSFLHLAQETLAKFQREAKGDLEQRQQAIGHLVSPLAETLAKVAAEVQEMEKTRRHAFGGLEQLLKSVSDGQDYLRAETGKLVTALRRPEVRGRWGELQLQKVVELAGMRDHCDFLEQATVETEEGRLRPDLIVRLPGGTQVVVDAKAPIAAYLEAAEAADQAVRGERLLAHAAQVRQHVDNLGSKAYWKQFEQTPEFVVMFIPGESFFSAALEQDLELIEKAWAKRVILASPTTLIALLRAVHYGWHQEKIAAQAHQIEALGKELFERLKKVAEHFGRVGTSLDRAVESYNQSVASLESRVLVTARKFNELGAASGELPGLEPVEKKCRELAAPEDD